MDTQPTSPLTDGPDRPGGRRAWFAVWLLTAAFILNLLDRQVINVLGNQIGKDLHLTDGQLGLIGGLGFSIIYCLFGIPWGWIGDKAKVSRAGVVAAALTIWSAATAFCGAAQNFGQLLVARMSVAAGEAGCVPPAQSLITDIVPQRLLGTALAIFGLGVPIGSFLGKTLGGVLSDAYGWRSAYFIVGIPGVLLAIALVLLVRDPRVKAPAAFAGSSERSSGSATRALAEMLKSPSYVWITLGVTSMNFLVAGASFWGMMHFQRTLGMTPGEAGLWIGVQGGITGLIGGLLGGWLADRWGAKQPRHYMTPSIIGMALTPPLLFVTWSTNSWWIALLFMALPGAFDNAGYGGASAAQQRLITPPVRAQANALMMMCQTLLGSGMGVSVMGMASDAIKPMLAPGVSENESVRYVLLGAAVLFVVPAACFWFAYTTLERDLARVEGAGPAPEPAAPIIDDATQAAIS